VQNEVVVRNEEIWVKIEKVGVVGMVLLVLGASRCNSGTETDNPAGPLRSFQGRDCRGGPSPKDRGPPPQTGTGGNGTLGTQSVAPAGANTLDGDAATYNYLSCVAWNRTEDGELMVRFRNRRGGCGAHFEGGRARVEGNRISLQAQNRDCLHSACGYCFYDLEWIVEDVPESGDLEVFVSETDQNAKACYGEEARPSLKISEDEPEGERCEFIHYFQVNPWCVLHGECGMEEGEYHCLCESGTQCATDLTATDSWLPGRCLAECTSEADCAIPGAFSCLDGLCYPNGLKLDPAPM
jgi:hypothetical protein